MTASVQTDRATSDTTGGRGRAPLSFKQKLARGGLLAAVLLLVAMWVYAFGFASKDSAAKLDDQGWTDRAEEICDRRNELLADNARAIREADDDSPQAIGRGVQVATDLIEAALDDMVSVMPTSADDIRKVAEFERLYRIYIADRRASEAKLAAGEAAELNETTLHGSPISDTITDFTNPNRMESCAPPAMY